MYLRYKIEYRNLYLSYVIIISSCFCGFEFLKSGSIRNLFLVLRRQRRVGGARPLGVLPRLAPTQFGGHCSRLY